MDVIHLEGVAGCRVDQCRLRRRGAKPGSPYCCGPLTALFDHGFSNDAGPGQLRAINGNADAVQYMKLGIGDKGWRYLIEGKRRSKFSQYRR
jgi:hypothetical protein